MAAEDTFKDYTEGLATPLTDAFDVTPNDGVDIAVVTRTVSALVGGNITVTFQDMAIGDSVTLFIASGAEKRWRVSRIWATGTAATGIVGMY